MRIRRTTGFIFMSLFTAFLLAACGGGGDSGGSAAPVPGPEVTTASASSISVDNAVLNGTVIPGGLATTYWFEWGTSSTLATNDNTSSKSAGSGTAAVAVSDSITGLSQGTTYYFRLAASNSAGTTKGAIASLTTASPMNPPTVQTNAADNLSVAGATLHASVIPNGLATTAFFEWGTDNTFAVPNVTPNQSVGSDNTSHQVNAVLTGLTTGTKYYYRAVATNAAGTSRGLTASTTTNTLAPTVVTNPATSVTTVGAVLNGDVNPNGLATTYHFEWGTNSTLTTFDNTSSLSAGAGIASTPVTASISGLTLGTQYYFRITASNSSGPSTGTIRNFTTVNPLPTADAGPDQTVYMLGASGPTEVTLDGSGSTDGGGGTLTYQWTQTAGPSVTLSSSTDNIVTFTAPVVTYPPDAVADLQFSLTVTSSRGPVSVADNVGISVKWAFLDDFSTDSTGTYAVDNTWGSSGTFTYHTDALSVQTGLSNGMLFGHGFGLIDSGGLPTKAYQGVFAFNFAPIAKYGSGGGIEIRLGEDFNNCYVISTLDNTVRKVFHGATVVSAPFPGTYALGSYWIKITFTGDTTSVDAFGSTFPLADPSGTQIPVTTFWISTVEQDAYYDNIVLDVVY